MGPVLSGCAFRIPGTGLCLLNPDPRCSSGRPSPPPAVVRSLHHAPAALQPSDGSVAFVAGVFASVPSVMFRSALNASACRLSAASSSNSSRHAKCRYLAFSSLCPWSSRGNGRMADVLAILGPLDSIFPPPIGRMYVNLFRSCIKSGDTLTVSMAHAHLLKSGLGIEPIVSNVLLNVYAKAGHLDRCAKLFDEMPLRDLVSWCTLISGHVSHGCGVEAFEIFKQMCGSSSLRPNHFVVSSLLKGCSNSESLELGTQLHTAILKSGLAFDNFVEVGLISMYSQFGSVADALKLFYEIPVKCRVSWNAMISGYAQNGLFAEAIELFRDMHCMGFIMDLVTLRVIAGAGSALATHGFCQSLHAYSVKIGLDADNYVVAEHVKLLSLLGDVEGIGKHFTRIQKPDVYLFSLLISAYHTNGHQSEAVKYAAYLFKSDLKMSQGALISVLSLCLSKEEGSQIHSLIWKTGHESSLSVSNALISMYSNCGSMEDARIIFTEMPVRDIVSWTAVMSGHVQNNQFEAALTVFKTCWGTKGGLDQHAITTILSACTGLRAINKGKQIHSLVLKLGFEFSDFLAASLLNMYAKCGDIISTTKLFSGGRCPHGLVPVNVMLAGYCCTSSPEMALRLFETEFLSGFIPDEFSFSTILGACADLRLLEVGQQLHSHVIRRGFETSDVIVGNAIINFYAKSGCIEHASRYFYGMAHCDANSYALLISGYVQNKCSKLAVKLFCQMHHNGLIANSISFGHILRGCVNLAALGLGKQVHATVLKLGFLSDDYVVNSLMGMYAKSKDMYGAASAYKTVELIKVESVLKVYLRCLYFLKFCLETSALSKGTSTYAHTPWDSSRSIGPMENVIFFVYCRYVILNQLFSVLGKMVVFNVENFICVLSGDVSKIVTLLQKEKTEDKNETIHALLLSILYSYDLAKRGEICANARNMGPENSMTEGYSCPAVKIVKQRAGLDESPVSICPIQVKVTASICQGDLAVKHIKWSQKKSSQKLAINTSMSMISLADIGILSFIQKSKLLIFGYKVRVTTSQTFGLHHHERG